MPSFLAEQTLGSLMLICACYCVGMTLISLASGYAAERYWMPRGRKIFDVPTRPEQLAHELRGTVLFHFHFIPCLALLLLSGILNYSNSWTAEILSFAIPWYGFQFYYYWLHRLMHLKPFYWMHKWHHASMVTSPMTGFSMHPAESVGWILGMLGPALLLSQVGLLGFWGYLSFLSFMWFGNIVGHANVEYMAFPATRLSSMLVSNPISYHCLHHARFLGHYGFGCSTMDFFFKTEFPDWMEIQDKVFAGKSLTSLHEKGPSYAPHKADVTPS